MNHFCLFGIVAKLPVTRSSKRIPTAISTSHLLVLIFGPRFAVHTQHTFIQRMFCWQSRKPEQRTTRRHIRFFDKLAQFALCISQFNTLSNQYKRTFSVINQFGSSLYRLLVRIGNRNIATDKIDFRRFVFRFSLLAHFWQSPVPPAPDDHYEQCKTHVLPPRLHLPHGESDNSI